MSPFKYKISNRAYKNQISKSAPIQKKKINHVGTFCI